MKRFFAVLLAVSVLACNNYKAEQEKSASAQFMGFIADASMHTVTVKALTSDTTYTFATTDSTNKEQANGTLIGSPIIVDYTGDLKANPTATKIACDATYAKAIGEWTMADPIAKGKKMGIKLSIQGVAESINMATLVYKSWELEGHENKIILKGESIGNGITSPIAEVATISQKDGKQYLTFDSSKVVLENTPIL